jgi:hypothetical protein
MKKLVTLTFVVALLSACDVEYNTDADMFSVPGEVDVYNALDYVRGEHGRDNCKRVQVWDELYVACYD